MEDQPSPLDLARSKLRLQTNKKHGSSAQYSDRLAARPAVLYQGERGQRPGRPGNVLARLQALLPHSGHTSPSSSTHSLPVHLGTGQCDNAASPLTSTSEPTKAAELRSLKVRMISWNMHDSLPKGDLETLLGHVPPYTSPPEKDAHGIPLLGESNEHPYHIVVVAGQECPSLSGIPMAFGAGYKLSDVLDKDRDKKAKKKKSDEDKRISSSAPRAESPSLPAIDITAPQSPGLPMGASNNNSSSTNIHTTPSAPAHPGGWSSILDDWFSKNIGSVEGARSVLAGFTTDIGSLSDLASTSEPTSTSKLHGLRPYTSAEHAISDSALNLPALSLHTIIDRRTPEHRADDQETRRRLSKHGSWLLPPPASPTRPNYVSSHSNRPPSSTSSLSGVLGPYELAAKERMMGIYMAVYVHRDLKPLLQGVDKSAVTTGLIGGRVGNKGGVGISLNIAGKTFLFINAHLAAHEARADLRMTNLAKIKAELSLDCFLPPDDPRLLAEDITDRFDHTFICGDLNFRLDISRLHADWLIARKDYAHALEFDQLRNRMRAGELPGFCEASITFPPTFKYDVHHSHRSRQLSVRKAISKTRHHLDRDRHRSKREGVLELIEVAEAEDLVHADEVEEDDDDDSERDGDGDGQSMASTTYASSAPSKYTTDPEDEDDSDESDGSSSGGRSPAAQNAIINAHIGGGLPNSPEVIQKILLPAAQKAKSKWLSLMSSSSKNSSPPPSPTPGKREDNDLFPDLTSSNRATPRKISRPQSQAPASLQLAIDQPPTLLSKPIDILVPQSPSALTRPQLARSIPTGFGRDKGTSRGGEPNIDEPERGVYDSSSKKRVPSWCDRILFKSAVVPDPITEETDSIRGSRGHRVGQFLAHAIFRRDSRSRNDSLNSMASSSHSHEGTYTPSTTSMSPTDESDSPYRFTPFSRFFHSHTHLLSLPPAENEPTTPHRLKSTKRGFSNSASSDPNSVISPLRRHHSAEDPRFNQTAGDADKETPSPMEDRKRTSLLPRPRTSEEHTHTTPELHHTPLPENNNADLSNLNTIGNTNNVPVRRWFQSRTSTLSSSSATKTLDSELNSRQNSYVSPTVLIPPPLHRQGDVVCLSYETLDDRGMQKLQGRSDHRPVLGTYVCYL